MSKGQTIAIVVLSIVLVLSILSNLYFAYLFGACIIVSEEIVDELDYCDEQFWEMNDLAKDCLNKLDVCFDELELGGD